MIRLLLKILLPILVLGAGLLGAWHLMNSRTEVQTQPRTEHFPLVRIVEVRPTRIQLRVHTQGTVVPRTQSALVPEVSGRLVQVSPSLAPGGFFTKDELLLKIDPRDYELSIIQSEAEIAQIQRRLEQEKAEAEVARREWAELGKGEPSALLLRRPQLAEAEASQAAARAALERASRNLQRTEIRAPYDGRVRSKSVDLGQYVTAGSPVAQLYAVDFAEVRLPLPDQEAAFLDLPLHYREGGASKPGPQVLLKATFAGRQHNWLGRIVRTEGEIDPATRMLFVVAEVEDPYSRRSHPGRPPLVAGMFVQAAILGRWLTDVVVLPRKALRENDTIMVVDTEERLRFRPVSILRIQQEQVLIQSGLAEGEQVCISPLETPVDGMRVRTAAPGGQS